MTDHSAKKRKFLHATMGASEASAKEHSEISDKHLNKFGEFKHRNMRTHKIEHIKLDHVAKFNKKKFALMGKSPNDGKNVSMIIHHE